MGPSKPPWHRLVCMHQRIPLTCVGAAVTASFHPIPPCYICICRYSFDDGRMDGKGNDAAVDKEDLARFRKKGDGRRRAWSCAENRNARDMNFAKEDWPKLRKTAVERIASSGEDWEEEVKMGNYALGVDIENQMN
ncbi:hypothetical protein CC80DRAFT_247869 [Byssothecium circinans]|uniref:Uncharacterized protein n=1 Tax=Byssothecium circinans TaxID=147558 RepID=A0A6A5TCM5_9PLEO|nr:hypothetical protein CC80DRAFT_247869 [Byssothecium circinans]